MTGDRSFIFCLNFLHPFRTLLATGKTSATENGDWLPKYLHALSHKTILPIEQKQRTQSMWRLHRHSAVNVAHWRHRTGFTQCKTGKSSHSDFWMDWIEWLGPRTGRNAYKSKHNLDKAQRTEISYGVDQSKDNSVLSFSAQPNPADFQDNNFDFL